MCFLDVLRGRRRIRYLPLANPPPFPPVQRRDGPRTNDQRCKHPRLYYYLVECCAGTESGQREPSRIGDMGAASAMAGRRPHTTDQRSRTMDHGRASLQDPGWTDAQSPDRPLPVA